MATSVFEIIGPIMVGPSSSHTAGMARIGMMANRIINEVPIEIHLELSPKMKTTYFGHKSDAALFGGTIGMKESDSEIRDAIKIANEKGICTSVDMLPEGKYPQNSARITVTRSGGEQHSITGTSVGGGSIVISEIDRVPMEITADAYHLIIWSKGALPEELLALKGKVQKGIRSDGIHITSITSVDAPDKSEMERIKLGEGVLKESLVKPVLEYGVSRENRIVYRSCVEACEAARERGISLAELAIDYEVQRSGFEKEAIIERMYTHLQQMKKSVEKGKQENRMLYNLTGGKDGKKMWEYADEENTISGGVVPRAVAMALGVMEYNGSMGCLVAAPTAGSSGIIPGCMVAIQEKYRFTDEQIVNALFVSALMGVIMAEREVSFSGSVGGCQGEVGVSSAISAAGLASLFTVKPEVCAEAMALCLKNLLGLVCDPIAAPIEVPCIKRNAVGVANAFISADMAIAGIQSFIPPDEVIDALVDVERRLPPELKCATVGGLACTCTAKRVKKELGQ